jgi:hypothetical protein
VRTRILVRTDVQDSAVESTRRFSVGTAETGDDAGDVNRRLQDAYDLSWKLATVLGGGPEWISQTYQIERIAGRVSPLTLRTARPPRPKGCAVVPGDRAPDAPLQSASGAATRLAALLRGPHWTLLGYDLAPTAIAARDLDSDVAACAGLRVHAIGTVDDGAACDFVDIEGELQWAYGLSPGDRVLIRPDGVVAAIVADTDLAALRTYLASVGLRRP